MAGKMTRLRYHCVEVIGGPNACDAARGLKGQRLISAEAPLLPLATCQTPGDCRCVYRHFDDRRKGPRRAEESGRLAGPWVNTERRRRRPGRRDVDFD